MGQYLLYIYTQDSTDLPNVYRLSQTYRKLVC